MLFDRERIKEIIPHREPFLLVDEVLEMEEGKRVAALKRVEAREYYFEGHFPNEKVMPGVLVIEALAQAGAIALLSMPENKGKTAYFGGIKEARFKRKVVPGDCLRLEVTINRLRSKTGIGTGAAYVDGELACECEIMFAMG